MVVIGNRNDNKAKTLKGEHFFLKKDITPSDCQQHSLPNLNHRTLKQTPNNI